jgi:hypothetical protein
VKIELINPASFIFEKNEWEYSHVYQQLDSLFLKLEFFIFCDTSKVFPRDENRKAAQDPISQQDAVLLALPQLGQELLFPSLPCTLVEPKRCGVAASLKHAATLAVLADFSN